MSFRNVVLSNAYAFEMWFCLMWFVNVWFVVMSLLIWPLYATGQSDVFKQTTNGP